MDSPVNVGFVNDGTLSAEQEAALEWLRIRPFDSDSVTFEDFADAPDRFDVLWWHRDAPVELADLTDRTCSAVTSHLESGGGLLLTLQAMDAVEAFDIERVPPDAVGVDSISQPTGVLWRSLYDDHRAVASFDSLRLHVCDCGAVPFARYESVLPARGEILGSTVRGEQDVPHEMTVVSWNVGAGTVIGVGAPVAFDEPVAEDVAATRSQLTEGCLDAIAGDAPQPSRPKDSAELRAMREQLPPDSARPGYHFTPPANWLNDPNGLIKWGGRYHVFYQYNPAGPFHNTIHWGHAVSDDLIHWQDEPVALSPSPDGPDRDGCWSGCAVNADGTPTLLYTGGDGRVQLPCLATSDDPKLRSWEKYDGNPVIEEPPSALDILETDHWAAEFRDHSIWQADGTWYQVIGCGLTDDRGAALLYSSEDLQGWNYEGPLLVGEEASAGTVWECPELLDFGERQLLHISNYEEVVYFIGELRDGSLAVDSQGVLDHGSFYAPQSLRDGDRYLTWGWLPENRNQSAQWDAGWSGVLSLPRVVDMGPEGHIRQRPAAEVRELRQRQVAEQSSLTIEAGDRHSLNVTGRSLELELEVGLYDASAFELSVFESPDRERRTLVRYTEDNELLVDRSSAGADSRGEPETQRMPVTPYDEPLSLRVFLDGSVVELYANERHCLTSRVYTGAEQDGLSVATEGGSATIDTFSAWELRTE